MIACAAGPCYHPSPYIMGPRAAMSQDQQLTNIVKMLCNEGYQKFDQGDYDQALRSFYQAWVRVPKPQTDYREAGWALAAIGDCYFAMDKQSQAQEALESCLCWPEMSETPFVHLRYGQSLLVSNQVAKARKHLFKAYQLGGEELFAKEPDKYIKSIEDLLV